MLAFLSCLVSFGTVRDGIKFTAANTHIFRMGKYHPTYLFAPASVSGSGVTGMLW